MNIKIVRVNHPEDFSRYEHFLPQISPERRERIARMKFPRKKSISLVTELLMVSEISRELKIAPDGIEFSYGERGKPYVKGAKFFFSVSHSGDYIAFAGGAASPVGVDIQTPERADYRLAKRFFTAEEYAGICEAESPEREFFRIWTLKEAYVKMLGAGMAIPFSSFCVLTEDFAGISYSRDFGNFVLSVCGREMGEISINCPNITSLAE